MSSQVLNFDYENSLCINPKKKLQLCKTFTENGYCPYGQNCLFAHGVQQLTRYQPSLKKKLCRNFHKHQFCKYGSRCNFKHQVRSLGEIINKKSPEIVLEYYPQFLTLIRFKKTLLELL